MVNFDQQFGKISDRFTAIQNDFLDGKRSARQLSTEIDLLFAETLALGDQVPDVPEKVRKVELLLTELANFGESLVEGPPLKRKLSEEEEAPVKKRRSSFEDIPDVVDFENLNLRPREDDTLEHLKSDYALDSPTRLQIDQIIKRGYNRYLSVRGDGNCYYRAVYVQLLQEGLKQGKGSPLLRRLIRDFRAVKPPPNEEFLDVLRFGEREGRWLAGSSLIEHLSKNRAFDQEMIRLVRAHLSDFIEKNKNKPLQGGLTPQEIVDATGVDLESFRKDVVEKMGEEATDLIIPLLAEAFATKITVVVLTKQNVNIDTYGLVGQEFIHVLFRPGHYDILYK